MCLKESFFPDYWKASSVVPAFKRERPAAKKYRLVILLFVVRKVFETLVNNRFVDRFEKYDLLSDS